MHDFSMDLPMVPQNDRATSSISKPQPKPLSPLVHTPNIRLTAPGSVRTPKLSPAHRTNHLLSFRCIPSLFFQPWQLFPTPCTTFGEFSICRREVLRGMWGALWGTRLVGRIFDRQSRSSSRLLFFSGQHFGGRPWRGAFPPSSDC